MRREYCLRVLHVEGRHVESARDGQTPDILFDFGLAIKVFHSGQFPLGHLGDIGQRRPDQEASAGGD